MAVPEEFSEPSDLTSVSKEFQEPSDLASVSKQNNYEAYLNSWFKIVETKYDVPSTSARNGCVIRINGDLGQPQPVYLHNNNYPVPDGKSGKIHLNAGEEIIIACTGTGNKIQHPNITASVATATATCVNNALVSSDGWLKSSSEFHRLTCSTHSVHEAQATNERCYNNNRIIRVGFKINNIFYPLYQSCFDQDRLEVLYTWHEQNQTHAVYQDKVGRPYWLACDFYSGIPVNKLYTQIQQKATIANHVGQELADKYINAIQYLARGHLATKTNFIYATGQRATFYFINAAPQWQPFNSGNWNLLEQNLRTRIGIAGYNTTMYTGTFGVSQLRDQNDRLVDIYLYRDANNNPQIPVPLYYYKVVYDGSRRQGTAFVSINNPYYTEAEVRSLTFCTDRCRNNNDFNWLHWHPDRIDLGYSFCCTVDDFRRTIPHLPVFSVDNVLT